MSLAQLRTAVFVGLAALLGAVAGVGGYVWYQEQQGVPRPAFVLPDTEGQRRSIAEWDGQVVVLNFWATWCAPCREEIPLFIELQKRYGEQGLQFVGVAVDRPQAAAAFAEEIGMNYPTLHGIQAAMEIGTRYGNDRGTLPFTVIIDRTGRIRHVFTRQVHREDIEPVIRQLLNAA